MKAPYSSYSAQLPGYGTSLIDRINVYLHFRKYLKVVTERWLLLVIFTVIGTAVGVWLAVTKPDQFRASSVLATPQKISLSSQNYAEIREVGTDNTLALMQAEPVLQRTLVKLMEGRDNTNKLVRPNVGAIAAPGGMFVMNVTSTNFEYAQKFASVWAQEFVDFKKQQRKQLIGNTEAHNTQTLLTFEKKLEQAQLALDDFQKKNNFASFEDAGGSAQRNLDRNTTDQQGLQNELQIIENSSAEQLASGGTAGLPSAAAGKDRSVKSGKGDGDDESTSTLLDRFSPGSRYPEISKEIRVRERKLEEWSAKLKDRHPYILETRSQIAALNGQLEDDIFIVEKNRQAYIQRLRQRLLGYPKIIEALRDEVFSMTSMRSEYQRLKEDEKRMQDQVADLRSRATSMDRIGADDEQFNIIQQGGGDPKAVGPNRPSIVGTAATTGLMVAALIIFTLHRLDDRLESPEDIEAKLEEPILGQLPEVDKKHYTEGYLLLTRMKAHTMFAESLRGVRSSLLLSPEGSSKRMLAVTSAVPGDGKTTFTANFAITLANSGNKTLLVDADLRRGNVHGYFEQPLEGGLSEVLEGKLSIREATRETGIKNLYFMRAGERPANPSELLIGPATKELVKELRSEFDYVVFDCPPLTAIDDTFSIAAFIDGLFFVVRAGKTSIRFAKMGINTIHQRGAPMLGIIVNGVPIDNPYYYYTTYYYASYYHRPLTPDASVYPDKKDGRAPAMEPDTVNAARGKDPVAQRTGSGADKV